MDLVKNAFKHIFIDFCERRKNKLFLCKTTLIIAFVNFERRLIKSRVYITQCKHEKSPASPSVKEILYSFYAML